MPANNSVLIVDDEEHIRKILDIMLSKNGYKTAAASNGIEALEILEKRNFDAVVTDIKMPGMDGLELLSRIKEANPDQTVIVVTAFSTVETAIQAMKSGAFDYISKPFKEEEILLILDKALERKRILDENKKLKAQIRKQGEFSKIIGRSKAMQKVFDIITKVADTKSTVLITGESGTGKELVARSIHEMSGRREKSYVPINCGAVPPNLLENEFFGHARGAFSGADHSKTGLFAEADGGTLFLDEVSELPLDMQVKILRAIQEEEIRRLGESATIKVDLRIVAATNKGLLDEVKAGRFREDLYYRLNVVVIDMPPLRERVEDIPLLADHFLKEVLEKHGLPRKRLSTEALDALTVQKWSGNVRALSNVIEQAIIMTEGDVITAGDLPFKTAQVNNDGVLVSIPEDRNDLKTTIKAVTEQAEKIIIGRALDKSGNNRTRAARILGISRRALINKIQAYNLQ